LQPVWSDPGWMPVTADHLDHHKGIPPHGQTRPIEPRTTKSKSHSSLRNPFVPVSSSLFRTL
jgi:hypothetical protein